MFLFCSLYGIYYHKKPMTNYLLISHHLETKIWFFVAGINCSLNEQHQKNMVNFGCICASYRMHWIQNVIIYMEINLQPYRPHTPKSLQNTPYHIHLKPYTHKEHTCQLTTAILPPIPICSNTVQQFTTSFLSLLLIMVNTPMRKSHKPKLKYN